MQTPLEFNGAFAPQATISMVVPIESFFAGCAVAGFAFSLLIALAGGRFGRRMPIRFPLKGGARFSVRAPKLRIRMWKRFSTNVNSLPGAIPAGIGAFLTFFGLFGLALRDTFGIDPALSVITALALSIVVTLSFLTGLARFFAGPAREIEGCAAVGSCGKVTLAIPIGGMGSIAFEREGKRSVMPARAANGGALPTGMRVFIVDVRSGAALVEEL